MDKEITLSRSIFACLDGARRHLWPDEQEELLLALVFRDEGPKGWRVRTSRVGLMAIADTLLIMVDMDVKGHVDLAAYCVNREEVVRATDAVLSDL